jgi:pimeloyl-ACP methyl ester carboxylesterase
MSRRESGQGLTEATVRLIDGRVIRYVRGGEHGPLVILESGLGDAAAFWVGVQEILATACRTLSYDRSGLGGSDPAPAPRTIENMVADTIALMDAIGIEEPAVLVGHSWGGPMIRLLAERAPERVSRVMLVDPTLSAIFDGPYLEEVDGMFRRWYLVSRLGGRRLLLRRFRDGRWPEMSKRQIDIALADHWTSADLRTSRREAREIRASRSLLARLESTPSPVPTRFLIGMRRPEPLRTLMSTECARIAAVSPDGSIVEVEDSGHSIPQERPRRTAHEIRRFAEA